MYEKGAVPDPDTISYEKLNIPERYWVSIIDNLYKKGYIEGVYDASTLVSGKALFLRDPAITMDGIEYLENNSTLEKAKSFLKELKEIVPGL